MPLVTFGSLPFEAGLVVFDKDGTLLDFDMWNHLARIWIERLVGSPENEALRAEMCRSLGYDPAAGRADPQGPLAIATTAQLMALAAGALYRFGFSWPAAEDRARHAFDTEAEFPLAGLIQPAGDLPRLFGALRAAGVRVAVVTTDHRRETEETLRLLGVAHLVDHAVCGDDGLPAKPAPDMLLAVFAHLGAAPASCAVVGDTLGDMLMARRAGAGLRVGVLTGAGTRALLAAEADAVLDSVDDIHL